MGKYKYTKLGKWEGNHQDLLPVEFCLNSFPGVEFPLFPALSANVSHENWGEFVEILKDLGFPAHIEGLSHTVSQTFGIPDSGKENFRTIRRILAPATHWELFKAGFGVSWNSGRCSGGEKINFKKSTLINSNSKELTLE